MGSRKGQAEGRKLASTKVTNVFWNSTLQQSFLEAFFSVNLYAQLQ